jgi:hypothetical protein
VYIAPCARSDGCRIAALALHHDGNNQPAVMTADCGWSTRVPFGAERYLLEAIERWRGHRCLSSWVEAGEGHRIPVPLTPATGPR